MVRLPLAAAVRRSLGSKEAKLAVEHHRELLSQSPCTFLRQGDTPVGPCSATVTRAALASSSKGARSQEERWWRRGRSMATWAGECVCRGLASHHLVQSIVRLGCVPALLRGCVCECVKSELKVWLARTLTGEPPPASQVQKVHCPAHAVPLCITDAESFYICSCQFLLWLDNWFFKAKNCHYFLFLRKSPKVVFYAFQIHTT